LRDASVLQISGEVFGAPYTNFLCGIALLRQKKFREALECFRLSQFRITDSLLCSGICAFYLGQPRDSLTFFDRSIRAQSALGLFNLAELCGCLGKVYEQQILLQFFARAQFAAGEGSLATLYLLAQMPLREGDFRTAVERYQFVLRESVASGVDLPSPTFTLEYAHALNQIGDFAEAEQIFDGGQAADETAKLVRGHTLWGARQFDACRRILDRVGAPEAVANRGILTFLAGNDADALRQLNTARRFAPKNTLITRNAVLVHFAGKQTVRDGCIVWLTALRYQLHEEPHVYDEILAMLNLNGKPDPVTLAALKSWKKFRTAGNDR
jgi:tetratricopeptide (TPR) repeat protein